MGLAKWINNLHSSIKFSMDSNQRGIPFLDTCLTRYEYDFTPRRLTPNNTSTHRAQSYHPLHLIKAIPYSQALRIK